MHFSVYFKRILQFSYSNNDIIAASMLMSFVSIIYDSLLKHETGIVYSQN